jgi:hypothetical protein
MLHAVLAAAALGHAYHTATDGSYSTDAGGGEIILLEPGEQIRVDVTGVDSLVITPALKKVDPGRYSLACTGGNVTEPALRTTYTLEPFFQIGLAMPWPKDAATGLSCTRHLTFTSRETTEPMLVFIGAAHGWDFADLMERGGAVLALHGRWNDAAFTFPLALAASALVVAVSVWLSSAYGGPQLVVESKARYYFYLAALTGFAAAAVEGVINAGIAQFRLPGSATVELAEALGIVVGPNAAAIALIVVHMYVDVPWPRWGGWLELAAAFSFFLFFYAGLYVGPACYMAAACARIYTTYA